MRDVHPLRLAQSVLRCGPMNSGLCCDGVNAQIAIPVVHDLADDNDKHGLFARRVVMAMRIRYLAWA